MLDRLKIIPLLIIVAMLAFSVRLVEVVSGVRDLSGSAYAAAEEKPAEENTAEADVKPAAGDAAVEPETENAATSEDTQETAEEDAEKPEGETKPEASAAAEDENKWRDASDEMREMSPVSMEMFKDMAARREELDKRARDLTTREALLQAAEQELERKYQEMDALRAEIKKLLEEQSEEEKARLVSLVKIYEGMKPKEAARIFDTLDLDILVSVASQMSERKLSPVLASMNPDRAKTLTVMLAEQKTLPTLPEEQ
jgi:flagellar motility protein MotE (MotC chaperone)